MKRLNINYNGTIVKVIVDTEIAIRININTNESVDPYEVATLAATQLGIEDISHFGIFLNGKPV
jgi:hypothetical protein